MNLRLPVFDERHGAFAALRDRRVLVYFPHGLGDFVHFSYVAPLLEPSNRYFITRFGDDFVHLYDENSVVTPLPSGTARPTDGREFGAAHLGIDFRRIRNREEALVVPEPLRTRIVAAGIDAILYTDYPEREGRTAFPYQTKARALVRDLAGATRLDALDLAGPLQSCLPFTAPAESRSRIEPLLRAYLDGGRLYLVSPGGHSSAAKVWPDRDVASLARLIRARDERARVLWIDERRSDQIPAATADVQTAADVFEGASVPFAHLLVTLIRESHAFVGVPSGPLHAALAIGGRPVVGIWLAHFPDWYDEPSASGVHLVGPDPYRRHLERRPATVTTPPPLRARVLPFKERPPNAADVLEALGLFR